MVTAIVPTWEADFDLDGTYEFDLTPYVGQQGGFSLSRGADKSGAVHTTQITVGLQNRTGIFTPGNTAGTLYGQLEPGVPIRVTVTLDSVAYTLWTGYLKSLKTQGSVNATGYRSTATFVCQDIGQYLQDHEPTYVTVATRLSGAATIAILTAAGLGATDYLVDDGQQSLEYHFSRDSRAATALNEVTKAEMGGYQWVRPDGRVRFQDRSARLGVSRYAQVVRSLKPTGYWRFDHVPIDAGTLYQADESGNGNELYSVTLPSIGQAGLLVGETNGSGYITGSSGYFEVIGHPDDYHIGANGWGFVGRWKPGAQGGVSRALMGKSKEYVLYRTSAGVLKLDILDSANAAIATVTGPTLTDDVTYTIGASVVDDEYVRLYVDGALVGTDTTFSGTYAADAVTTLMLGDGPSYTTYEGYLDEIALFDHAPTAYDHQLLHFAAIGLWVWGDGTNVKPFQYELERNDTEQLTKVSTQATVRLQGQADEEIFRFSRGMDTLPTADSMVMAAGAVYEADFPYAAPITALVTPVANTDYRANTAIDGSGTDVTSSLTVTATDQGAGFRLRLVNTTAANLYVTFFRLRGQVVPFQVDRPVFTFAKSVDGTLVDKGVQLDVPFVGDSGGTVRDYALSTLRTFRYAYPRLTLTFKWSHDDISKSMMALDFGDLVYYKDTGLTYATGSSGTDEWWYVENIRTDIQIGKLPTTVVSLVPSYLFRHLAGTKYDLFTRDNTASGLGLSTSEDTWESSSTWAILSNKARPLSDSRMITALDVGKNDQVAEVSISGLSTAGDGANIGVALRWYDDDNHIRVFVNRGTQEVVAEQVFAATVTEIGRESYA